MGCRDNNHIHEEVYAGCSIEICIFKVYASIIYSNSRTYAGFLKETRVYIKKSHFKGTFAHFQNLVSFGKFELTRICFQWSRGEVK